MSAYSLSMQVTDIRRIRFSVNWKINMASFDQRKTFVTSYDNFPLEWLALLSAANDGVKLNFGIYYMNGPAKSVKDVNLKVVVVKPDGSVQNVVTDGGFETSRGRGCTWEFSDINQAALRPEYGLRQSDPLVIAINLSIASSVFSQDPYPAPALAPTIAPQWISHLFNDLTHPERSLNSDIQLIARDGVVFHCHKVIAYQSEALQAQFQGKHQLKFRKMGSASLKILLQYLYTGQVELVNSSLKSLVELAYQARISNLKSLMESCVSLIWKKMVRKPEMCIKILSLSYSQADMVPLKYRAMDILAENYQMISGSLSAGGSMSTYNSNVNAMQKEFFLFLSQRFEPIIGSVFQKHVTSGFFLMNFNTLMP